MRSRLYLAIGSAVVSGSKLTLEQIKTSGLVPKVSVCEMGPAKGWFKFDQNDQPCPVYIDETTIQQVLSTAKTYSGGLRVNAGHFTGVLDAAGYLDNYEVDPTRGLLADMHLFPSFEKFDHLCSLIATIPDTFGLSIDFSGPTEFKNGKALARCSEIYSADLVTTPAANSRGLFCAGGGTCGCAACSGSGSVDNPEQVMTLEQLTQAFNDLKTSHEAYKAKCDNLATQLTTAEQTIAAQKTELEALKADKSAFTAATEAKTLAESVSTQLSETRDKLSKRMGLEFAARAGAKPAASGGSGDKGETRKSFEIPAREAAAASAATLLGLK